MQKKTLSGLYEVFIHVKNTRKEFLIQLLKFMKMKHIGKRLMKQKGNYSSFSLIWKIKKL